MSPGRPTDYTEALGEEICARLAEGRSLRDVCKGDGMPDKSTVFRWLAKHDNFRDHYARSCETRALALAEDTIEIADDSEGDFVETENGLAFKQEHVQRARLRVDTRKWFASKLFPRKYGDKITQEVTGAEGGPIQIADARQKIEAEVDALLGPKETG